MTFLTRLSTYKRHLAYRFWGYILLLSAFFTLIAMAFQLYSDYQQEISLIQQRLVHIEQFYLDNLANSLQPAEPSLIESHLQSILALPDVDYLEVHTVTEQRYIVGKKPEFSKTITRHFSLYSNTMEPLGTLNVIVNLNRVYQHLKNKVIVLFIIQLIKTSFVSLFILLIFQYVVIQPLSQITGYIRQLDLEHLQSPFSLKCHSGSLYPDELDELANAINKMRLSFIKGKEGIQANENRLIQFLEVVPVGIAVLDARGKPCYINKKARQLIGEASVLGEMTDLHLSSVYQICLAGTTKRYPKEKRPTVRVLQGETAHVDDMEIRQPNKIIPIEVWGTPILEHEKVAYAVIAFQDITERRQAEAALRQAEQKLVESLETRFHDMASNVPGVIYQWYERKNGERGYYYLSPQCEELFGVKAEDLQRDFRLLPVHPDDALKWYRNLKRALKEQQNCSFESRFILTTTGEIKWWRVIGKSVSYEDEVVLNGIVVDITEQKALEAALRQSEADLADAQRMALVGSWVWNIKTGRIQRSVQDCLNHGINPKNYQPTYEAFIERVHPEDRIIIDSMLETCIIEEQTAEFEFRVIWPNGNLRTMRSQAELESDESDTPIRLKGFTQDITEQKQAEEALRESEQRFRDVSEAAGEYIWEVDTQGRYLFVTDRIKAVLGYDVEEMTGRTPFEFMPREEALRIEILFQEIVATRGRFKNLEHRSIHFEGQLIWQSVSGIPIRDKTGKVIGYRGTALDITERKKAEEQLQTQNAELITKNFELERLTQKLEAAQREKLYQLNKAYERFVPREFLKLLDKESVIEVQLGDQVEKEMTILFSDIRGFTGLSEEMTPLEIFDFVNNYMSQMEPVISKYHGVIDKYIGDAIMAVFPTNADDAVRGSIAMLRALNKYNKLLLRAGLPLIQVGIGLNTGPLMLGTVGGPHRMDGTVIADAVNVASRVEGLTKKYGIPLLITEQTYLKLRNVLQYKIRVVDHVKVKGKSKILTVYEVFDADDPLIIELKLKTLYHFEQGFMCFHHNQLDKARFFFEKVLHENENDQAARVYWERC